MTRAIVNMPNRFADDQTMRLPPIPEVRIRSGPADESPTVAILDRWRDRRVAERPTRRLWPRGNDGGFAERFLRDRRSRHMDDT